MSGHNPGQLDGIRRALDALSGEALAQVRDHLDALMARRAQNGDDPSEAPES